MKEDITTYLRDNPEKKAREIANDLGVDRRAVNSVLYRWEGSLFEKNSSVGYNPLCKG